MTTSLLPVNFSVIWHSSSAPFGFAVRSWVYPRMADMGYIERYRSERFRKLIELGHPDEHRVVWPSLARYAARRNNIDPRNPPVSVALVRHWSPAASCIRRRQKFHLETLCTQPPDLEFTAFGFPSAVDLSGRHALIAVGV